MPADAFRLLAGEESLRDYQFGKKQIHHLFCAQCAVRPFSHAADPNGNRFYAVRVNCLDGIDPQELIGAPVKYFDMLHDEPESVPADTRHL